MRNDTSRRDDHDDDDDIWYSPYGTIYFVGSNAYSFVGINQQVGLFCDLLLLNGILSHSHSLRQLFYTHSLISKTSSIFEQQGSIDKPEDV